MLFNMSNKFKKGINLIIGRNVVWYLLKIYEFHFIQVSEKIKETFWVELRSPTCFQSPVRHCAPNQKVAAAVFDGGNISEAVCLLPETQEEAVCPSMRTDLQWHGRNVSQVGKCVKARDKKKDSLADFLPSFLCIRHNAHGAMFYVLRFNIELFKNPIIADRYHAILALALCYANTAVS